VSNHNIKFLALLDSENSLWSINRKHNDQIGYGFCGISYPWHKDIIEDERFFTDARWQIEQCYKLWTQGTKFYGNWRRTINNFVCQEE